MLQDTMNRVIRGTLGGAGVIALIIVLICAVPALFIWTVNSIATAGGVSFQLEHNLWTYFLVLLFLAMVRGGKN